MSDDLHPQPPQSRPHHARDPQRDQQVQALLEQGLSVREVVRQSGASYGYVHKRAIQMGRHMTRGHQNPETHPWKHSRIGKPSPQTTPHETLETAAEEPAP